MLARSAPHSFDGRIHHVASGTEVVRVLSVIPCHCAGAGSPNDQHCRSDGKRDFDCGGTRCQPPNYCRAMTDERPENCYGNNDRDDEAPDLDPGRNSRKQEPDDLPDAAWERRLDCD